MSMNGSWKQVNSENGLEFCTAIGATAEQAAKTATGLTYAFNGNTVTITRNYGAEAVSNTAEIGGEGEIQFMDNVIKCAISGKDGDLTIKFLSGWATATAKIVGNQLVETVTHNESGMSMTNTWERA